VTAEERFWSHVDASGDCWEWTASRLHGYGQSWMGGRLRYAHRVAYELLLGPIPESLYIDHLCRNRGCVNPDHLELVTFRENTLRGFSFSARNARKTHCKRGHPFTPDNVKILAEGGRRCRACTRALKPERQRRYRQRRRERLAAAS
jgi:hypothetical protein